MNESANASRWLPSVALAVACACAPVGPPPPETSPTAVEAPSQAPGGDAELRRMQFESGLMVMGRQTGAPWVEIEVGGVTAKAILDTGAELHVVQAWFAAEAGLRPNDGQEATVTDSSKKSMNASFTRVRGEVKGWGPMDTTALVIPTFDDFEAARVGMVVNPLLLATPGHALQLDFQQREVAELEHLSEPVPGVVLQTCASVSRLSDGTVITTLRQVTDVEIAGFASALIIDSGARTTLVAASSDATEALQARVTGTETAGGVLGTQAVQTIAHPVPLTVAGTVFEIAGLRLGPEEPRRTSCNDHGVLGMDVLKHCVVELSLTDTRLSCRAPV